MAFNPFDLMQRLVAGQAPAEPELIDPAQVPQAAIPQRAAEAAAPQAADERSILERLAGLQQRADQAFNDYEAARNMTPEQRQKLDQARRERDYFGFDPKGKTSFMQKLKKGLAKTGSLVAEAQGQRTAISRRPVEDFEKKREEEMAARLRDAGIFMGQLGAAQDDYRMQRRDREANEIQRAKVAVAQNRAEVEQMAAEGKLSNEGKRLLLAAQKLEIEGRTAEAQAALTMARAESEKARGGFTGEAANDYIKSNLDYEKQNAVDRQATLRYLSREGAKAYFRGSGGGGGVTTSTTTKTPAQVDVNGRTIPGSTTTVSRKGGGGGGNTPNPLAEAFFQQIPGVLPGGPSPTTARTPPFVPSNAGRPTPAPAPAPQLPAAAGGLTPARPSAPQAAPQAPTRTNTGMGKSRYLQLAIENGQYLGDPRSYPKWQQETTRAAEQMNRSNSVYYDTVKAATDGKLGLGQEWRDNLARSLGVPQDVKDTAVRFARAEENFRRTLKDISGTAFGVQEAEAWKRIMGSADLKSNQYGLLAISGLQAMASQVGHMRSLVSNNAQKVTKVSNPELSKRINERLTHMTDALVAYEKGDKTKPLVVKARNKEGKWVDRALPRERFGEYLERIVDLGDDLREALQ